MILFHLWPTALPGGFTGVDIFFVISGFVVTGSLIGRQFDSLDELARYFYARRLMRIMPAICRGGLTVPRAELIERRAAVVAAMKQLAKQQTALSVWDPFPVLCPADPCRSQPDGRPLFFDGGHLSGLGNDLLYPNLRDTLLALRGPSPYGMARSTAQAGP